MKSVHKITEKSNRLITKETYGRIYNSNRGLFVNINYTTSSFPFVLLVALASPFIASDVLGVLLVVEVVGPLDGALPPASR
jgi:hypothetical protein